MHDITLILVYVGIISLVSQWLAWRIKIPAILLLLLSGLIIGPVFNFIDVDHIFGNLLFPFVLLSVAIILFEGSLTLKWRDIREHGNVVRNLVTIGLLVTWVLTAVMSHFLLELEWSIAWLFGALVSVTGPTVIVPMLRTIRPNASIANILRWEGILIDPLGALLVVLVYEFLIASTAGYPLMHSVLAFFKLLGVGGVAGAAAGYLWGLLLRNHSLPEHLRSFATLIMVLGIFVFANQLQEESGLFAVTVMGIWLANMEDVDIQDILHFKETLSALLISALFILLAARLTPGHLQGIGWSEVTLLAVLILVIRPFSVFVSCIKATLGWRERMVIASLAPRGIVAAAVAALVAIRLTEAGLPQAEQLVPLTFFVIIGTVIIYSLVTAPLARVLGVAEPEPRGFLIVGANIIARAIAAALDEAGFRTILADSNREYIKAARMDGRTVFYGNPVSEEAEQELDLVGIGRLLAVSPDSELNSLAVLRYRHEFGRNRVYTIQTENEKSSSRHKTASKLRGNIFAADDLTYKKFASLLSQGAEIRSTRLSEDFTFDDYMKKNGKRTIPLFAITPDNRLRVFVPSGNLTLTPGWTVISLVQNAPEDTPKEETES
ncbi:MAG TPA: sodium:proton antiporter [Crenotrichaceae bacterium]|nr:sodium:proton antiporter [Crenotrichaceae bacterium]